jgi:hypothetical protein
MKRKLAGGVAVVALVAAGVATYSWAASANGTTINACADNDGKLRVVQDVSLCKKGETPFSWNTTGPVGPVGPVGPTGPTGPTGAAGRDGRDGRDGTAASSPDAVDATLSVADGVAGDGTGFTTDLTGFANDISQPSGGTAGTGAGAGKVVFHDLTITKKIDAASAKLFTAVTSGRHLPPVTITLLNSDGTTLETIELQDVFVSDFAEHGATEQFSLAYGSILIKLT